jgi:phenylalanyl-tRNA synthetase beta chain
MTPNRGDCFSHLGIARELSIIENKKIKLESPVLKHSKFKTSDLINVEIKNNDICKRYACRIIKNITIKESPQWLVNKLYSIGQKSINNVVDLANYIMFDLGQPLHVFDYDKLKGNRIEVRLAKKQEKILCLNNELKILSKNDIIIADSKGPVAIAGVIGGLNSHVNIETSNILIESAVFNEINIRRTAKKYEYAKEASKRFERGVDSSNVINVMDEFSRLLIDIAGGEISSDLIDIKKKDFKLKKIKFNPQVCNNFLGTKLDKNEFKKIFFKLSIDITINKNNFICVVPSYRNDIEREVDLFEEVARVYGYDNIPSKNKFIVSSQSFVKDQLDVEDKIRNILSNNGFNEHYSNSLYNKNDVKFFNHIFGEAIEIKNPLSNDMKFLRNSLIPGILRALSFNEKREQDHIKFYEIGSISKISNKTHSNSQERRELNIAYLGSKEYSWKNKQNFDIFDVKGDINMLCNNLGLYNIKYEEGNEGIISIIINNKNIGFVSYLNTNYKKYYDIYRDVIIVNLRIDSLIALCENNSFIFKKISPYPTVTRDIAILIDISIKNEEIINIIKKSTSNILSSIKLFDIYQDKYLGKNTKSLAYSLKFQSLDRTLKINEVDKEIQLVLDNLKSKLNAKQR